MKVFEYGLDSKGFHLSEVHRACLILIDQTQHGFRRILVQSVEELARCFGFHQLALLGLVVSQWDVLNLFQQIRFTFCPKENLSLTEVA